MLPRLPTPHASLLVPAPPFKPPDPCLPPHLPTHLHLQEYATDRVIVSFKTDVVVAMAAEEEGLKFMKPAGLQGSVVYSITDGQDVPHKIAQLEQHPGGRGGRVCDVGLRVRVEACGVQRLCSQFWITLTDSRWTSCGQPPVGYGGMQHVASTAVTASHAGLPPAYRH
jgi:hypothetical protein